MGTFQTDITVVVYSENKIKSCDGYVDEQDIKMLVEENQRRTEEIFGDYDPFTGLHCYAFEKRIKVRILDFLTPDMWVLPEMFDNIMFKQIVDCGSIKNYLEDRQGIVASKDNISKVQQLICQMRCKCDPEFGIYITDQIQDKLTGAMVPFKLNYPQRRLLKALEDSRRAGEGTYIVLLKARQWGGSTLTQLYMKWVQDFLHDGWNAIIIAQTKNTSKKIKAMYKKAVQRQPGWTIGQDDKKLVLVPYENSQDDFIVSDARTPIRRSIITVSAFEIVDNARGENYHMAHMSEVAYWKQTQEHDPEAVISSILGGIRNQQDNFVVFESTGRGASGFFYDTWQEARDKDTPSLFKPLFIPFYIIENDHKDLVNETQEDFARWLLANKDSGYRPTGYKESGKFFWRLWRLGASFEAINWYRVNRNAARDHATWATEAPVDDVEAFKTSGNLVFNPYTLAELRDKNVKDPVYIGDINLVGLRGKKMIQDSNIKFRDDGQGEVKFWSLPNNNILRAKNRYIVCVDIGGNSARADYSVMTVIDRLGTIPGVGGRPEIVARYRAHCRHDKLAWKAAVLAHYYDDALLVVESNTADRERNSNTEGDHFGSIIEQIADFYDNIYMRIPSAESVSERPLRKYGFQTNKLTKQWVIDNLVSFVEDELFVDPDAELYHELAIYERRDDGSLGNIPGANNHDDIVMSLAIGLWVSTNEWEPCDWMKAARRGNNVHKKEVLNEAAF